MNGDKRWLHIYLGNLEWNCIYFYWRQCVFLWSLKFNRAPTRCLALYKVLELQSWVIEGLFLKELTKEQVHGDQSWGRETSKAQEEQWQAAGLLGGFLQEAACDLALKDQWDCHREDWCGGLSVGRHGTSRGTGVEEEVWQQVVLFGWKTLKWKGIGKDGQTQWGTSQWNLGASLGGQ